MTHEVTILFAQIAWVFGPGTHFFLLLFARLLLMGQGIKIPGSLFRVYR